MGFESFQFTQDDARVLADKLKELYEAIRRANGEPEYRMAPASPERLIQLAQAAILAQINHDIDYTGKGNLLYFADENSAEHIGYLYGERGNRLSGSYALTTLRYTLSVARSTTTHIPKGYRVTPDNNIFFATIRSLEIPPGELFGEVEAQCLTPGTVGNGFAIGEIKNMVDLISFIVSVKNITVSTGGTEKENLETYKARLRLLPESFSVAGPDGAYEFWARTANPEIIDAKVWMPELEMQSFAAFLAPWGITDIQGFYNTLNEYYRESGTGPGNVNVTVLMKDGELPSNEVLLQVAESLNKKTRRPLTDFVHVIKPTPIEFNVEVRYWIETEKATEVTLLIDAVKKAVDQYIEWQKSQLGLDILHDFLHKLIMNCGVKRLEIIEPEFKILKSNEVAQFGGNKIATYEGLEEA